ncbi:hypothetical protein T552_01761 [Pneumocystis carinii B80]|uniref:Peripheral subunit-binding (PSBD) domain-containing protein n=1 Tax=Pneumocystis carinii (strain B80) TaxID=1408658 RepID=A0A0W4ZJF5_PNEC8|nr:hypothetical protein T552_01761 [Pneumocystis carinii B80]KTW28502.1 hypothetical protein T552_01761 [Pneumocystis carinii B80]
MTIFTNRINRNDISAENIMKDRLENPVTISSPAVLSLIKHYNITNPFEIKTTGPQGRLLKGDILAYVGAINRDFPLKLVKIIEEKEKLDLNNLKIKPKQPIENSFISIIIPVSLKSFLSMKESVNEKLNIKMELSDLMNKAIYKGTQKVPSIFLKKPSTQEILFSNVLGEIPKYYDCINLNINDRDFQIDYIKDEKTKVLWASPKIIRFGNIIFPSSISLSLEEILEVPKQNLKKPKENLDIIDFLAGNIFDKSSMSTKEKYTNYTIFIRIKLDKSYTDIHVAKTFIKELKSYIETPETLLL